MPGLVPAIFPYTGICLMQREYQFVQTGLYDPNQVYVTQISSLSPYSQSVVGQLSLDELGTERNEVF